MLRESHLLGKKSHQIRESQVGHPCSKATFFSAKLKNNLLTR